MSKNPSKIVYHRFVVHVAIRVNDKKRDALPTYLNIRKAIRKELKNLECEEGFLEESYIFQETLGNGVDMPFSTDSDGEPCTFRNHYNCLGCGEEWEDVWSCECDDECPNCGISITPYRSENLVMEDLVNLTREHQNLATKDDIDSALNTFNALKTLREDHEHK